MRWNRLFIVCCSSLLFLSFAGCKKVVRIKVNRTLAPVSATATPGATLEWVALSPGEEFDVKVDSGLCTQKSPLHASYGHPATCIVPPQQFGPGNEPNYYNYSIDGTVDGTPFHGSNQVVSIGPKHCPGC